MSFEKFHDGRHSGNLGYRNGTILAILNLHVATMPPTKFHLNLFVCVEVLRPSQPNGVMSTAVSLPNHRFTGQA